MWNAFLAFGSCFETLFCVKSKWWWLVQSWEPFFHSHEIDYVLKLQLHFYIWEFLLVQETCFLWTHILWNHYSSPNKETNHTNANVGYHRGFHIGFGWYHRKQNTRLSRGLKRIMLNTFKVQLAMSLPPVICNMQLVSCSIHNSFSGQKVPKC